MQLCSAESIAVKQTQIHPLLSQVEFDANTETINTFSKLIIVEI